MKRCLLLIICISFIFTGCTLLKNEKKGTALNMNAQDNISVTDSNKHIVTVKKAPEKVVALSSSLAQLWMLSGGKLAGVSSDAAYDRNIGISKKDVEIIGTAMKPNTEKILALHPDLVILSQDMSSNIEMTGMLNKAEIPYYICKIENLDEYLSALKNFVSITGKEEKYRENGEKTKDQVTKLINMLPSKQGPAKSALVLRTYSSGVNTISGDNVICNILNDIHVNNIAQDNKSLLKNLSIEAIIQKNPDYIFIDIMGSDTNAANASLKKSLASNPAWRKLTAVKDHNVYILPKELYQYKPNNRWGDSYEYLLKIIYPEIYKTE